MMVVLGIDPGVRSLGLAKLDYQSGEIVQACGFQIDGEYIDTHDLRLGRVCALVKEWASSAEVVDVWIEEGISHRNGLTTRRLSEAAGVIKAATRFTAQELNITEIKKHAIGKGSADKDQMAEAAYASWPDLADHLADTPVRLHEHAIDALWIADLGRKISIEFFKEELENEQ